MSALLDRLYRWLWRVPECRPGACYCRRSCALMVLPEDVQ